MIPIVIGITAAVLLGGGAMAFLFTRDGDTPTAETSAASSTATTTTAPAAAPEPTPEPAEPAPADPEPAASAEPEVVKVKVVVKCNPECDRVEIDGKDQDKTSVDLEMEPGTYKIRLIKKGYLIHKETLTVAEGKGVDKTVNLIKIGPAKPRPKPNCSGQFLCP